jgi:hypothetical protein
VRGFLQSRVVEFVAFVQEPYRQSEEWRSVEAIAQRLLEALNQPAILELLAIANRPEGSSALVQAAFEEPAKALGFESERKGLFLTSITGLRPDYYLRIGSTGILLEVERGKTTTNNMDLLDFWKCHLCNDADYLFLLVPRELRHNAAMKPKKEFISVQRRLKTFFEPVNYTNVRGLCLFGY